METHAKTFVASSFYRLDGALRGLQHSRNLILFGQGVLDSYLNPQGEEVALEDALLAELKTAGFERVVFFSTIKSLYYLDSASQNPTTAKSGPPTPPGEHSDVMKFLDNGPFGSRLLLSPPAAPQREAARPLQMGDVHAIRALDFMMRAPQAPHTAIVFPHFENTLNFFEDPRMLSGVLESWANLPEANPNRCLFLFSSSGANTVEEQLRSGAVRCLENLMRDYGVEGNCSPSVHVIGGPGEDEIRRLLEREEKTKTSTLTQEEKAKVTQWMLGEGQPLKLWAARVGSIEQLDWEQIREAHWFSAQRNAHRSAAEEINELVGLENIKERFRELRAWMQLNIEKTRQVTQTAFQPTLNFVFSGNPGTGKTTVARLMGEMLHEIGYLKRGHLVEVNGLDLAADHVGGTAVKTNRLIDEALDGVLFIDEAYALSQSESQDFGKEAIATLLTRMENDRERLVVIAAGYPQKMIDFLSANPGLSRRFPVDNFFSFPDFSPDEMWMIFERMNARKGLRIAGEDLAAYFQTVSSLRRNATENFGNAGEVRNLVEALERKRAMRVVEQDLPYADPLRKVDIPEPYQFSQAGTSETVEALLLELNELVGLEGVKRHFTRLVRQMQLESLIRETDAGNCAICIPHIIFSGNPGTGKTTVARLVGQLFKSLGLLKIGHCVEVTRADLVAGYVGQTALKTQKKIEEALDGVLFVDEAYALTRSSNDGFGLEAIDTLVKGMDRHANRLLVIAAGYPQEMGDFVASNPGLKSRFQAPLDFEDFNLEELMEIFSRVAAEEGFYTAEEVSKNLENYILTVKSLEGNAFGNARSVEHLFQTMKGNLAERVFSELDINEIRESGNLDQIKIFKPEDVPDPPLYAVSRPFTPRVLPEKMSLPRSDRRSNSSASPL